MSNFLTVYINQHKFLLIAEVTPKISYIVYN